MSFTDSPSTSTDTASKSAEQVRALVDDRRRRRPSCRAATAQGRAHAGRQLARAERLGHVVVGAGVEPGHAFALAGAGRHHDDRHRRRGRALPQDAAHLQPAQHRDIQVEQHQVGRLFGARLERRVAAGDQLDLDVAAALERVADEVGDVLLVFDDQHAAAAAARHRYRPGGAARPGAPHCWVWSPGTVSARMSGRIGVIGVSLRLHRLTLAPPDCRAVTRPLILGYAKTGNRCTFGRMRVDDFSLINASVAIPLIPPASTREGVG